MTVPPKVHIRHLDGIRGAAALYVVACHSYVQVWNFFGSHEAPPGSLRPFLGWLLYGRFAVDLFIVLSGYCLMLPVLRAGGEVRGGALDFYRRRARRIVPTYYAAIALSVLLDWTLIGRKTGTYYDSAVTVDAESLASCFLMAQHIWQPGRINPVFWSIAVEWWIYFLLPPLAWAWRRFGAGATAGAVAVASFGCVPLVRRVQETTAPLPVLHHFQFEGVTVQYVALFAFGMLAATIGSAERGRAAMLRGRLPWGPISAALGAVVVAAALRVGIGSMYQSWARYDLPVGLGWSCMLVYLATARGAWLARLLSWRPLVACGVIGYSLYLIHAPLLQVLYQHVFGPLGEGEVTTFAYLIAVGIPLIVAASSLFARAFEPASRAVVEARAIRPEPVEVAGARARAAG